MMFKLRRATCPIFSTGVALLLATTAPAVALRVACVGDSITYGYNAPSGSDYPRQLPALVPGLEDPESFGIPGATMLRKGANPYWNIIFSGKTTLVDTIVSHQPDIVLLMLGTNDANPPNWKNKADFLGDYCDMITKLRSGRSHPTVYVMIPIPVFAENSYGISPTLFHTEVVPMIKEAAAKMNAPVIDLETAFKDKGNLVPDHVHPNADGYKLLAEDVADALKTAPNFPVHQDIFLDTINAAIDIPAGAEVRYTLDGTLPTLSSPKYEKPLPLTATTTINAAAVRNGQLGLPASATFTKEVPRAPETPAGKLTPGLTYRLYQGSAGQIWRMEWDENLFVKTGDVASLDLSVRTQPQWFAVSYSGFLNVPADGLYTLNLKSLEGSVLTIGDEVVIDNGGHHGAQERMGRIALKAGLQSIQVRYFYMCWQNPDLEVTWEGPGLTKQAIPATAFSHVANP